MNNSVNTTTTNELINTYANENVSEIKRNDFIEMLNKGNLGHVFFSMVYFTSESKSKTVNKQKSLNKRTFIVGMLGASYETKVMNQAQKENAGSEIETTFKKASYDKINNFLGQYPKDNSFCMLYATNVDTVAKTEYFVAETNEPISTSEAKEKYFTASALKEKEPTKKDIFVNNVETTQEQKFNWFAIKIQNIEMIKINKQVYKLID